MIESINPDLCTGCGICSDSCTMDVIRIDEKKGKAVIEYPEDCCSCSICKIDCPKQAIVVSWRRRTFPITSWGL